MLSQRAYKTPWYEEETERGAASTLDGLISNLEIFQDGRNIDLLRYMSMYANTDMLSLSRTSTDPYLPMMPRQIFNKAQALVDTLVSKHVLAETRVVFQTEDGDWLAGKNAEDMEKFVWGEFSRLKVYEMAEIAFRDALIMGDGWLYFQAVGGKVYGERVLPLEMIMDETAAATGHLQDLYRRRYMSRAHAMAIWPQFADDIKKLPSVVPPYMWPGTDTDMVRIVAGWHLPREEGGDDGAYILACGSIVIERSTWKTKCFPFARMKWSPTTLGGYSFSLMHQLLPLQNELNKLYKRAQQSLHMMSVPRIWQQAGASMTTEYNNMIGNVYKYVGQKPEVEVSQSVAQDLFEQMENIKNDMNVMAGVSAIELASDMPSRVDSAPGLEDLQQIVDSRHAWVGKMWERFFPDVAEQIIRVAREIVADRGSYKAMGYAKDFVEQIDWKDCNLEDDRFIMKPQPVSLLPVSVAGKRSEAIKMMQSGLISDQSDMWEMLSGHPDIDALRNRKTASRRLCEAQIRSIVHDDEYVAPDQFQNADFAKNFAQETYMELLIKSKKSNKNKKDLTPVLNNLIRYILACEDLIKLAAPPPPPPLQPVAVGANPNVSLSGSIPGSPGVPVGPPVNPGVPNLQPPR